MTEEPYFIINDKEIIYFGEYYENTETGEYFRWITNPDAKGEIAKEFEFKIRHSVKSSKFKINSTKVSVESSAVVTDAANDSVSGYNDHPYSVSINGTYSRTLDFSTGGTESGTISGLVNGGSCQPEKQQAEAEGDDPYNIMNREAEKIPAGCYGMMCAFSDVMNFINWKHAAPTFTNFELDPEKFNRYTFYRAILKIRPCL